MRVAVIIVSWNVREALRECLAAVRAEGSGCVREAWVVDNASGDGSAEMVAAEFPEVRLIRNAGNVGFACAVNQADISTARVRRPTCSLTRSMALTLTWI